MKAQFGWIDFSKEHRERVGSVIDMMTEPGTVDELGIGIMRDAISDWLFPGLSTIQTRPKYFLVILQIFQEYQKEALEGKKSKPLGEYLYKYEDNIMKWLAANDGNAKGVMGYNLATRNKGETLARKPSSIYWAGLRTHSMIDTSLSLNEYIKINDLSTIDRQSKEETSDLKARLDSFEIRAHDFNCLSEKMTLELTKLEAEYLMNKFKSNRGQSDIKQKHNLLSQLMDTHMRIPIIDKDNFIDMANALILTKEIHSETIHMLQVAIAFDLLMRGAFIRYNLILDTIVGRIADDSNNKWKDWVVEVQLNINSIKDLDFENLYENIVRGRNKKSKLFLINWQHAIIDNIHNTEEIDNLIISQEYKNKGAKAKLNNRTNLEDITQWVGMKQLTYRYNTLKSFITDIHNANA